MWLDPVEKACETDIFFWPLLLLLSMSILCLRKFCTQWNYVYFYAYLTRKSEQDLNGPETDILAQVNTYCMCLLVPFHLLIYISASLYAFCLFLSPSCPLSPSLTHNLLSHTHTHTHILSFSYTHRSNPLDYQEGHELAASSYLMAHSREDAP